MKLFEVLQDTVEPTTPDISNTAEIRADVYPVLEEKIAKLNKKAAKNGVAPITLTKEDEVYKEEDHKVLGKQYVKYYQVKIEGTAPHIAGYKFLATIEHKGEAGNVIRMAPGLSEKDPTLSTRVQKFHNAKPDYCDHCKMKRRRIDTYIVEETKTGKLRQIGRNCLSDFLGGLDPKQVLASFAMLDHVYRIIDEVKAEDETKKTGAKQGAHDFRSEYSMDVATVLKVTAAIVRTFGYKKKIQDEYGGYNRNATVSVVRYVLFGWHHQLNMEESKWIEAAKSQDPSDDENVQKILAWFNAIPQQQKDADNFMHSVDVIVRANHVTFRDVGYVVALFPMYQRANVQTTPKPVKSNLHIGAVGQKIPPTDVTCIRTHMISGPYGSTQIATFEDPAGNLYQWFNNSSQQMEQGKTYKIIGTVKKHDDYKGRKQTTLTRVKTV